MGGARNRKPNFWIKKTARLGFHHSTFLKSKSLPHTPLHLLSAQETAAESQSPENRGICRLGLPAPSGSSFFLLTDFILLPFQDRLGYLTEDALEGLIFLHLPGKESRIPGVQQNAQSPQWHLVVLIPFVLRFGLLTTEP